MTNEQEAWLLLNGWTRWLSHNNSECVVCRNHAEWRLVGFINGRCTECVLRNVHWPRSTP